MASGQGPDRFLIRHSVTVTASTLFEAAAEAVAAFKQASWTATAITPNAVLRVEVQPAPIIHEVPIKGGGAMDQRSRSESARANVEASSPPLTSLASGHRR